MAKKWSCVPLTVRRYRVSTSIIAESMHALRDGSAGRREWVILWQGRILSESTAEITRLIVPLQITGPYHFNIPLEERLRLLDQVSSQAEFILVQLHTHPQEAFHSQADDRFAITKHIGAISIVIANFGADWSGDFLNASVHRHLGAGQWRKLRPDEVVELLQVVP
jgi:hypothetical protein